MDVKIEPTWREELSGEWEKAVFCGSDRFCQA